MKPWLQVLLITLTVGGGFTGVSITLQQLFSPATTGTVPVMLRVGAMTITHSWS